MTHQPKVRALVVIPAHNEEASLPNALRHLRLLPDGADILVIDDGSTDKTRQVLDQWGRNAPIRFLTLGLAANCGIGAAVQTGYRYAAQMGCYDYVIQYDADGQHDAAAISRLIQACQNRGWDLAVGSRFLAAGHAWQELPPASAPGQAPYRSTAARRLGMRIIGALLAWRTGQAFTDPTSGFRCAGRRAVALFAQRYADDFPEPESLLSACRAGLACGEIPVRMFARAAGKSSIGRWNSLYYMVRAVLCLAAGPVERDAGNSWCAPRRARREPGHEGC